MRHSAGLFWAFLVFGSGTIQSCTPNSDLGQDPKKTLSEYVQLSFSVKKPEDRVKLSSLLAKDLRARLESWSEDQFKAAFLDSKRAFLKFSIKELKNISPVEAQITYELTYLDEVHLPESQKSLSLDEKPRQAKITNKKLCQLTYDQGKWLISDVRNLKELVEYRDELTFP